jgi:hypothetical protein
MNVQHSSDPPFQWAVPGCSNGYKEWYAQTPQHSTIHPLRTSNGYFNACDSATTEHPSLAKRSRLRTSDDQHYSEAQRFSLQLARTSFPCSQAVCGLLMTTRLGPITEAFRTGPGAAKVYRLSVCKLHGVCTHTCLAMEPLT